MKGLPKIAEASKLVVKDKYGRDRILEHIQVEDAFRLMLEAWEQMFPESEAVELYHTDHPANTKERQFQEIEEEDLMIVFKSALVRYVALNEPITIETEILKAIINSDKTRFEGTGAQLERNLEQLIS